MNLIMVLLIGTSIGLILSRFIFKEKPVGSLRVDQSDPDSGPYLFLKGFKFEETGTYTSTTFRGLFNRFRPTKK